MTTRGHEASGDGAKSLLTTSPVDIHNRVKIGETFFFSLFLSVVKNYVLRQVVGLCRYGHIIIVVLYMSTNTFYFTLSSWCTIEGAWVAMAMFIFSALSDITKHENKLNTPIKIYNIM